MSKGTLIYKIVFQFTPLREGRLVTKPKNRRPLYFNSRPSARGDGDGEIQTANIKISIHAPPRGATMKRIQSYQKTKISIHAPPRGATNPPAGRGGEADISIHAPPRGATHFSRIACF